MTNILSKNIVEEWNLGSLSEDKQEELVDRIGRLLYQSVLVHSLDILSEGEQTELDNLLDKDSTTPEEVLRFLQSKIPTFSQLVFEEREKLKADIVVEKS